MAIQVIWTTLPNGVTDDGALKLSVFVSFRLSGGTKLKDFPTVLRWVQTVQNLQFTVNFGNQDGPAVYSVQAKRVAPNPDGEIWAALFDENTPVKPYEFENLKGREILSYPIKNIEAKIQQVYVSVAAESPTDLPNRSFLRPLVEDISFFEIEDLQREWQIGREFGPKAHQQLEMERQQKEERQLKELKSKLATTPLGLRVISSNVPMTPSFKTAAQRDFFLFRKFHHAVRMTPQMRAAQPAKIPTSEDFHQRISSLGTYPYLLRLLGLVFDLEVSVEPQKVQQVRQSICVWVTPTSLPGISFTTPRTAYECDLATKRFMAQPRTSEISNGMLRLNDESTYSVVLLDVENAAFKLMNYAYNLMRREAYELLNAVREEMGYTPAPQIAQVNSLEERMEEGGGMGGIPAPKVTSEPSTEIRHGRPLPKITPEILSRIARFRVADRPVDEGLPMLRTDGIGLVRVNRAMNFAMHYQTAFTHNQTATSSQDPTKVVLFYEDIMRGIRIDVREIDSDGRPSPWRSLCQRFGEYKFLRNQNKNFTYSDEGFVETAITEGTDGYMRMHEVIATWRGWSLCVPRPGNVLGKGEETVSIGKRKFRRYETGVSRSQLAQLSVKLGLDVEFKPVKGSLPRLRFGRTYQLRARVVDLAGNSLPLDTPDDSTATGRILYARSEAVLPPVLVFRELPKEGESLEHMVIRTYNKTEADNTKPTSEVNERFICPPPMSQLDAETHGMFDFAIGAGKDPAEIQKAYEIIRDKDGSFNKVTIDEETRQVVNVPEGEEPPTGTVTYPIESGDSLRLPYLPDPLARGATFVNLPGTRPNQVFQVSFESQGWPDSLPFRIQLAEGTGEPRWDSKKRVLIVFLPKAEIVKVRYSCYLAQEDLKLMYLWQWLQKHKSVKIAQLQPIAVEGRHWMFTPFREIEFVHAVQKPLQPPTFSKKFKIERNFGETFVRLSDESASIHTKSTGKVDVIAEWEEWVDVDDKPVRIQGNSHLFDKLIHYPEKPRESLVQSIQGRHEFGDTKHRRVNYKMIASTRFREYFPPRPNTPEDKPENFQVQGPPMTVSIPSSARPAAPKVLYVIPVFKWESQGQLSDGKIVRRRLGGLRVYMERPWYSSGDGELLGVVLATTSAIPEELRPYVTQLGADPLWRSALPKTSLSPKDFKRAVQAENNLTLDELPPNYRVAVAGHEVGYDEERQLWYCDIEINAGEAYFPFVRLALARYQPNSLQTKERDVKLSRVVLTEFAQLAPDRTASITFLSKVELAVSVTGVGPVGVFTVAVGTQFQSLNEVEVTVEKRTGTGGDFGWVAVPEATFQLKQVPPLKDSYSITWTGKVTLPEPHKPGQYRLVIKEYERFTSDEKSVMRRLVYADVVEI